MSYKVLDKGSQYHKRWGKYRIDLDGYVYTENGKMILWLGEDGYEKHKRMRAEKLDRYIENRINANTPTKKTS